MYAVFCASALASISVTPLGNTWDTGTTGNFVYSGQVNTSDEIAPADMSTSRFDSERGAQLGQMVRRMQHLRFQPNRLWIHPLPMKDRLIKIGMAPIHKAIHRIPTDPTAVSFLIRQVENNAKIFGVMEVLMLRKLARQRQFQSDALRVIALILEARPDLRFAKIDSIVASRDRRMAYV
ncbi:MAG: hypothetical protein Q7T03_02670 [Deltaproteobacteria bacterium]|nr:hypothetical protein [Deltaproteobacteria bacterium]